MPATDAARAAGASTALAVARVSGGAAERAAWDDFALRRAGGNVMQSWGWAELKRQGGWEPVRLWARRRDGAVVAAMHVLFRRIAPGVTYGYAPRGPALADLADESGAVVAVVAAARREARRRRAFALKLDPEWRLDDPAAARLRERARLRDSAFEVQHRSTYLVDLEGGAEAILARVKPSTRRNIRLAERHGVRIEVLEGPAAVARYYPLFLATATRQGFRERVRPASYYAELVECLGESCPVAVLVASVEGVDVSGMIAAAAGPRLCFLFGGNTLEHARAQPSYLLHWHAIGWGLEHGCTFYDMWGVPSHEDPAAPGAGYFEFKLRWNGRVVRHQRCQDAGLWPALGPLPEVVERLVSRRRPLPD